MARRIDTGSGRSARPSILVADGSPTNRLVLRSLLENAGYRVDLAPNGPDAITALKSYAYDLALLDAALPELDGPSTIRRVRALPGLERGLLLLAIASDAAGEDRRQCLTAGADDCLLKPFRCSDLKAALERLLGPESGREHGFDDDDTLPTAGPADRAIEPVLDSEILTRLGGDLGPEALAGVLVTFTEDMGIRLHRIAAAAASANLRTLLFESHAVSSCCRPLGALRLAQLCGPLESAALSGDRDQALTLASAIGSVGADTLSALSDHSIAS